MCNLYSITTNQEAIARLFGAERDGTGNLSPLPAVFPDTRAPVIRTGPDGARELALLRWGMPPPPAFAGPPVTNIRNTRSPHWRPWLGPAHRCLVPVNAFCEYEDVSGRKVPVWFARDADRPLFCFAGLWTAWHGRRGPRRDPVEGRHELFGFLTCAPNGIVGPVHPKAMPVCLTDPDEMELWLRAPAGEALSLQRPLPDPVLRVVARGAREDPPPVSADLFGPT